MAWHRAKDTTTGLKNFGQIRAAYAGRLAARARPPVTISAESIVDSAEKPATRFNCAVGERLPLFFGRFAIVFNSLVTDLAVAGLIRWTDNELLSAKDHGIAHRLPGQ